LIEANTSYIVPTMWTAIQALEFLKKVEEFAPQYGYHVGLTGGVLYKDGPRKDLDMIIYPHNDPKNVPDDKGFEDALLNNLGIIIEAKHYGWLKKAKYGFCSIDMFYLTRDRKGGSNNHGTGYPIVEAAFV
jgi:hypothetical protein